MGSDEVEISMPTGPDPKPGWMVAALIVLVACAIDLAASLLLRGTGLGFAARVAVALLPLPGNIAIIVLVLRRIRGLDDFQKRIHFEAVTLAFLSTGVGVFLYGYLELARAAGPFDTRLIWVFMLVSYGIGYFVAASRYR